MIDGNDLPLVGLAAFCCPTVEETRSVVQKALDSGIRHFQVAELFGNAHVVWDCIRASGLDRSDIFITLKVWPKERNAQETVQAALECLDAGGLHFCDLLVLHAPIDLLNGFDQWRALEYLQGEGRAKSLGLSNYSEPQLTEVLKNSTRGGPSVVEMEVTPFKQALELTGFCSDGGIVVMNNGADCKGLKSRSPGVETLAQSIGVSVTNLLLRYAIGKGHALMLTKDVVTDDVFQLGDVSQPLGANAMVELDALEEGLTTSWVPMAPVVED